MRASDMNDPSPPKPPLFGCFIRAQVAHAEIVALNLTEARNAPGVHLVLDAAALAKLGPCTALTAAPLLLDGGPGPTPPPRPLLAQDVVRYRGEPVALVIADTPERAAAAADLVAFDLLERPEVRQLVPGAEAIHPKVPGNLACDHHFGPVAEVALALDRSTHRVQIDLGHNRVLVTAPVVEAVCASWQADHLTLQLTGPGVWADANLISQVLRAKSVDITNPDLGHCSRSQALLPEYLCLAIAARALLRPMCWQADHAHLDQSDRDTLVRAEIGFDADFRITALRVNLVSNLGAYASEDGLKFQSEGFAAAMTGDYDIGLASLGVLGVYSNTPPLMGHSGAGRAEAHLTLEQLIETAARALQVDPVDLRRRNLRKGLTPFELPAKGQGLRGIGHALAPAPAVLARILLHADGTAELILAGEDIGSAASEAFAFATGLSAGEILLSPGAGLAPPDQQTAALQTAIDQMIAGLTHFLQEDMGAKEVTFGDRDFTAVGSNMRLSLPEAAEWAREKGRLDLLDIVAPLAGRAEMPLHRAEVEIDPSSGVPRLLGYWPEVAYPMAAAVLQHLVTDSSGDITSESAILLPDLYAIQGISEADALSAAAAIVNAVHDVVARHGGGQVELPLSPKRLRDWLQEAETGVH